MPERRILTSSADAGKATLSPLAELRIAKTGRLEGYAIVFDAISLDLGGFVERVQRGAIELEPDVLSTFNHRLDAVLGRSASGTLRLTIDEVGLAYSVELPDTGAGRDVRELVRRGDLGGSSFTFQTLEPPKWSKHGETQLRTLGKIKVSEVGPVTLPAYPDTDVAIRSLPGRAFPDGGVPDRPRRIHEGRRREADLLWRLGGEE